MGWLVGKSGRPRQVMSFIRNTVFSVGDTNILNQQDRPR